MTFQEKLAFFRAQGVDNWHEHLFVGLDGRPDDPNRAAYLVSECDRCGMARVVVSRPIPRGHVAPELIERANDTVGEACRQFPGRIYGLAYVDAVHGRFAVQEIDRCAKTYGLIGVKLYNQYTLDDDMQNPIIEYCIAHDMPILMHAGGGHSVPGDQPSLSNSVHFCRAAKKYPEARFIMAHIGGGGDWNWQLKGMADCPNVFCDVSGSVHDSEIVDRLVAAMGAERVLFGTDGSFSSSIGKFLGARLTDAQRRTILRNPAFARYLERRA